MPALVIAERDHVSLSGDSDAPNFGVTEFGLEADLLAAVPKLNATL